MYDYYNITTKNYYFQSPDSSSIKEWPYDLITVMVSLFDWVYHGVILYTFYFYHLFLPYFFLFHISAEPITIGKQF